MRQKIALVMCLSILAAGVIFSSLRVIVLTERIARLEQGRQSNHVSGLQGQSSELRPRIAPPDNSLHKVLDIVDGDTVKIETQDGALTVRIIGIDTPETVHPFEPVEPFGPEASKRASELLLEKVVRIQYDPDPKHGKWGKYGRLLVYLVLPDGRDYGLVMTNEGMAKAYPKYPFSRMDEYLKAEKEAQAVGIGMWKDMPSTSPATTSPY